ncbi:hypothetical protein LIA77_07069 [Sarocladium implicatum]|nr:hypothetical protein LIA77_07069 [Sarocladium implicatum]
MSPSSAASGVPRTRQRVHKDPPPLDVPDIDDDAAERKRVLNVLAQRRYREKKRLARLKERKQKAPSNTTEKPSTSSSTLPEAHMLDEITQAPLLPDQHTMADTTAPLPPNVFADLDNVEEIIPASEDISTWDMGFDPSALPSFFANMESLPGFDIDTAALSWPSTTASSTDGPISSSFFTDLPTTTTTTPSSSTSVSSPSSSSSSSFVDNYLLPVHELTLLKALLRIATRLNCHHKIWSLDAPSPFIANTAPPAHTLPAIWRPTTAQLTIPHHPLIDLIPWPSVRDRLLAVMTLPPEERPESTGGEMWFHNFVYDLEDNAEGVRIYGGDPYDAGSWEVGQTLFERWWFVFDRRVVDKSNEWRRLRGAPALTPAAIK